MDPATILPDELMLKILNYLPHSPDFANLACLSRRWRALVSSSLQSRKKVSLQGIAKMHSLRWHPLPMYSDINGRSGVSTAVHCHTLYVFGGRTDSETAMNDLSTFDLLTMEWKRLTTSGARPLPRSNAIMGFIEDKLFLYGGHKCPLQDFGIPNFPLSSHILRMLVFNDLYSFCRKTNTWKQILKDTEGPRLRSHYNGAFLPPVLSTSKTKPGLLILFEASGEYYLTFALLPESGLWYILPSCPQTPSPISASTLPSRPPMCALSDKDVLIITHHLPSAAMWILTRGTRIPDSGSSCLSEDWTWTEVELRLRMNRVNFLGYSEALKGAEIMCLPKLPNQEWPTVAMLRKLPFSAMRAHLNRRLREGSRRQANVSSSSSSSSTPSVAVQHETQSNPLVQVFDELHDPTQPAGAPGQPLRGAIIRRVASSFSSSSLNSLRKHRSTAASRKRRSSQVSRSRFTSSPFGTSSDEPDSDSDSDFEILALYTLSLSSTSGHSQIPLMLGELDGPSDQDYHLDSLPLSRSFSAFTYGLGSLLVFGVPSTRLVDVEYTNGTRDKRPLVWAISGSRVICGFEVPPEA